MDSDNDTDHDIIDNSWARNWEDQILDEYSTEKDVNDQQVKVEQEAAAQKFWLSFQNSASAVTNLYKDCLLDQNCWNPFQRAAGAVTVLYKDAIDIQRKSFELGLQIGCQKKIRDIITWAKKKRRTIRREELIAFLCGKMPPQKTQRHSPPRSKVGSRSLSERSSPVSSPTHASERDAEPDLTAFQTALAIQGLNGAMSNASMGFPASPQQTRSDELTCFIMDGLTRHNESRKRNSSTVDANMDSPTRKRSRFFL